MTVSTMPQAAAALAAATIDGKADPFGHAGQADLYALTRPAYPEALLARVRELSGECELAVDVGCGSGQLAVALAQWCEAVVGLDRSTEQLRTAAPHERVTYRAGDAYGLPLDTGSVDLLTIAQAMHWLELPRFFAEVRRVLRSGGTFAVAGYGVMSLGSEAMEAVFKRYYYDVLGSGKEPGEAGCYWDCSRPLLDGGFEHTEFPFAGVSKRWIEERRSMRLATFLDYLRTMSGYRSYIKERGDPLPALAEELRRAGGCADEDVVEVIIPFFLVTMTSK